MVVTFKMWDGGDRIDIFTTVGMLSYAAYSFHVSGVSASDKRLPWLLDLEPIALIVFGIYLVFSVMIPFALAWFAYRVQDDVGIYTVSTVYLYGYISILLPFACLVVLTHFVVHARSVELKNAKTE